MQTSIEYIPYMYIIFTNIRIIKNIMYNKTILIKKVKTTNNPSINLITKLKIDENVK